MSTAPRLLAIFSDSVRPVGPDRGSRAVARMAGRWLAVSPRGCPGPVATPEVAALRSKPRSTWATPGGVRGAVESPALVLVADGRPAEFQGRNGPVAVRTVGEVGSDRLRGGGKRLVAFLIAPGDERAPSRLVVPARGLGVGLSDFGHDGLHMGFLEHGGAAVDGGRDRRSGRCPATIKVRTRGRDATSARTMAVAGRRGKWERGGRVSGTAGMRRPCSADSGVFHRPGAASVASRDGAVEGGFSEG